MSDIIRDKGTKFPKLDKIQQSIRDEVFANENSIDEFLEDLQENISQFTAEIKEKNQEVVEKEKEKELKETSEYYQVRKDEINNSEIQNLEEKVEKKENVYEELLKEFKESLIEDFRNTKNLLSYDYNTLGHIKNKIEMYKTRNDNEIDAVTIKKNTDDVYAKVQNPLYRMNPDYRSSTLFHHQVYVPFNELNQEVKILTIKMMPANWRNTNIENHSLGACFVNLKLRGIDLSADISVYPDLLRAGINYGIVFYSEGSMNNGKDLVIKAYQDNDKLIITLSNPYKKINDIKELFEEESILLNIGIQTVLSANIEIPDKQIYLFDNKVSNFKLISSGILKKGDAIYGPLNDNPNDLDFLNGKEAYDDWSKISNESYGWWYRTPKINQIMLDNDKKLGKTRLIRINTIESDLEFNKEYRKKDPTGTPYGTQISSMINKYDNISEILIRTLSNLIHYGTVVKCFGWVMINTAVYPISQLKLTTPVTFNNNNDPHIIPDPISGLELLFDPEWFIERHFSILYECSSVFIDSNILPTIITFPGISIEGLNKYVVNNGSPASNNTKAAYKYKMTYSNSAGSDAFIFYTPLTQVNKATITNNATVYDNDNNIPGMRLCGYDLTLMVDETDTILNPNMNEMEFTYK